MITGGAGGMGLATAKIVGRENAVVLCDVRQDRLDVAAAALNELGMTPTLVNCDVTDRTAVVRLLETAAGLGRAERFNRQGLRIVSVSPGSVDTEMGRPEEQAGAGAMVTDAAVPRWGKAEEMAELLASCAGDKAGYLTGTDILNDGGVVASMRERARTSNGIG